MLFTITSLAGYPIQILLSVYRKEFSLYIMFVVARFTWRINPVIIGVQLSVPIIYFPTWTDNLYPFICNTKSAWQSRGSQFGSGWPSAGTNLNFCSIKHVRMKSLFLAKTSPGHCLLPAPNGSNLCFFTWSGGTIFPSSINLLGLKSNGFSQYLSSWCKLHRFGKMMVPVKIH